VRRPGVSAESPGRLGRHAEPAMWILVALHHGPQQVSRLFRAVRTMDGPIGIGTFFAAIARLERLALVERMGNEAHGRAYRLTALGLAAAGSVAALRSEARP
jgi:hypothetical protein